MTSIADACSLNSVTASGLWNLEISCFVTLGGALALAPVGRRLAHPAMPAETAIRTAPQATHGSTKREVGICGLRMGSIRPRQSPPRPRNETHCDEHTCNHKDDPSERIPDASIQGA